MAEKYEVVVDNVLKGLNEFNGFFSREYYIDFEEKIITMKNRIEESMKEGRVLKIGIVGEVKAGKSSFLNALIFDGVDVLPQACTPMTAALTKISYAEKSSAKIVFYSQKDWEKVERLAQEYEEQFELYYKEHVKNRRPKNVEKLNDMITGKVEQRNELEKEPSREEIRKLYNRNCSTKLKSCKELMDMYNNSDSELYSFLGQTIDIDIDNIENSLQEYIGANGKFTAIVKHVELYMNNEDLKSVQIVDTPGLNDPIISRSETTKKFLSECDVVFLLSSTGQFLSQEDILFMCETLPKEGVRNVIIVGSKFDSGVLDDNKSKDLKMACNSSKAIYDAQARENIAKCVANGNNKVLLDRISESLPPSYISSRLYSCAKKIKTGECFSEQENNTMEQLKKRFRDFEPNSQVLYSISGIPSIKRERLLKLIQNKQKIIEEKNREIVNDNKKYLLEILEDINIQATKNREDISSYDKEQLEKKLELLQMKLNSMRREIRNIFKTASIDSEKFLNDMKVNIDLEIDNYVDFDVNTKQERHSDTIKTGFLGLKKEHVVYYTTIYTASVSDVISNMRGYINRCKKYANEEFEKIINIRKLENAVKDVVIGAFDLSGKDFNENDILIPLEIVLKRLQIPKINISVEDFDSIIIDSFADAEVEDKEIHKLRLMENKALDAISKKIRSEIDKCQRTIADIMSEQSATFVDEIISKLTTNIEMLRNQIDNKEDSIRQYDTLCNMILKYKKLVNEMEIE